MALKGHSVPVAARRKLSRANRGERSGMAKLKTNNILRIRKLRNEKDWPLKLIANIYNISVSHVSKIARKETWRHLK